MGHPIEDMSDEELRQLIHERLSDVLTGHTDFAVIIGTRLPNGDYRNRTVQSLPSTLHLARWLSDISEALIETEELERDYPGPESTPSDPD